MSTVVARNPRTAWRRYGDVVLVITSDNSMMHRLNETGADIWERLEGGALDQRELIRNLCDEYDASADTIGNDVGLFIDKLCRLGVLLSQDEGAA